MTRLTSQQLLELAQLVHVGISVIDLVDPTDPESWLIAFNNPASSESSGADVERFRGKRFLESFPAVRDSPIIESYRHVYTSREPIELPELTYGDANVPEAAFRVWLSPLSGTAVLGQYVNVTAQRRAEGELRAANARLEAQVAERTQELRRSRRQLQEIAYAAAHDLETPLRSVLAATELLRRELVDSPRAEQAHQAAQRARQRVEALMRYTAFDPAPRPQALDTQQAIELAIAKLAPLPPRTRLDRRLELARVLIDPDYFHAIVEPLLSNALLYYAAGDAPDVNISIGAQGSDVQLEVSDRGIGIAREHHSSIFQAFRRLHGDAEYPGSGVGLALCSIAVDACRGRIEVESEPGRGSTFRVSLPGMAVE